MVGLNHFTSLFLSNDAHLGPNTYICMIPITFFKCYCHMKLKKHYDYFFPDPDHNISKSLDPDHDGDPHHHFLPRLSVVRRKRAAGKRVSPDSGNQHWWGCQPVETRQICHKKRRKIGRNYTVFGDFLQKLLIYKQVITKQLSLQSLLKLFL